MNSDGYGSVLQKVLSAPKNVAVSVKEGAHLPSLETHELLTTQLPSLARCHFTVKPGASAVPSPPAPASPWFLLPERVLRVASGIHTHS